MTNDIVWAGAAELAERIRSRELSPVEVLEAYLDRIESVNPRINAIVTLVEDAREKARDAERAVLDGRRLGPLHGVPFTIKDCIDTAGVRTTGGSLLFSDNVPEADATVVSRLKRAGGILMAKTNLPEFATDGDSNNRVFGRTMNPWNPDRSAGGSSGGEGAALAAGMSPLGVGSDVGGSIRIPATVNGVFGLKATHGRIPLTGHWPEVLLRNFHVGPLARTVEDIALALRVLAGPDGVDPYAVPRRPPAPPDLDKPPRGLRVGWSAEDGYAPVAREVQAVVERGAESLAEQGLQVEQVSLPWLSRYDYLAAHLNIFTAEVMHHIEPIIAGRESEVAPSTEYFAHASLPSLERYLRDQSAIEELKRDTAGYFRDYDVLLGPTMVIPPYGHDMPEHEVDGRTVPKYQIAANTAPWDYTGSPAISVPFGWSEDGMPIGLQVIGRHFEEAKLLRVAATLARSADDPHRRPPL